MKPLYDKVVVTVDKQSDEQVLGSGIIIKGEDTAKRFKLATVAEIGGGRLLSNGEVVPLLVAVGDRVMINAFSGTEVLVSGEQFTIIAETDILLVL